MAVHSTKARNCYAVMKWTNDGNRLSVHHLKHITQPRKDFELYETGDFGVAVYPGFPGQWEFVILAVGESKSEMEKWLSEYLLNAVEEGAPESKKKGKQREKSNQELGESKWLQDRNRDRQLKKKSSDTSVPPENTRESSPPTCVADTLCNISDSSESAKEQPTTHEFESSPIETLQAESCPQPTCSKTQPTTHKSGSNGIGKLQAQKSSPQSTSYMPESAKRPGTPAKKKDSAKTEDVNLATPSKKKKCEHAEDISDLKDELYRLKRRVKKLEDKNKKDGDNNDECCKETLAQKVEFDKNSYSTAKTLLESLFTKQELISHSVSGKAPNTKTAAKPKFDAQKYAVFTAIMKDKFGLETKELTAKVQAVQKSIMRETSKTEKTDTLLQI